MGVAVALEQLSQRTAGSVVAVKQLTSWTAEPVTAVKHLLGWTDVLWLSCSRRLGGLQALGPLYSDCHSGTPSWDVGATAVGAEFVTRCQGFQPEVQLHA